MNTNKILNINLSLIPFIFRKSREKTFHQSESSLKNGQDLSTVVPMSHFPNVLSKQKKSFNHCSICSILYMCEVV